VSIFTHATLRNTLGPDKLQGPGDGLYLVQNKHLAVNLPLHVDDEDLSKPGVTEKPLSEPTAMSYNRYRLKMAIITRDISDMLPIDPNLATYDLIISLDLRLDQFVDSLPNFFRMDKAKSPIPGNSGSGSQLNNSPRSLHCIYHICLGLQMELCTNFPVLFV
jgi:hypothetical protein